MHFYWQATVRFVRPLSPFLVLLALLLTAGCQEPSASTAADPAGDAHSEHDHGEHDHGEHATVESLEEMLASVESMKDKICQAFADGKPDDAHGLLHDVGHSLEQIPDLAAKKETLTKEQLSSIDTAVESLFDGFGKLDGTMHGGEEVDIQAVDEQLTQALAEIGEVVQ